MLNQVNLLSLVFKMLKTSYGNVSNNCLGLSKAIYIIGFLHISTKRLNVKFASTKRH